MIVHRGLLIGRPDGMDNAIACFLKVCKRVTYHQQLEDVSQIVDDAPDFVLVLQEWSDEYTRSQVETLLNTFPLSRVVCCHGPWCQSDRRTRQNWPASLWVPLADIAKRIELECRVITGETAPIERTAGLDELFAFQHQSPENKIS